MNWTYFFILVCVCGIFGAGSLFHAHEVLATTAGLGLSVLCLFLFIRRDKIAASNAASRYSEYWGLANQAGFGFYRFDKDGQLVFADKFCVKTGSLISSETGRWEKVLFPHLSEQGEEHAYNGQISSNGEIHCFESDILADHGEKIHLSFCEQQLRDVDGVYAGVVGVIQNLCATKGLERALERERSLLDIMMNCSLDSVSIQDLEGNLLKVNRVFAGLAGAENPDSCVGVNIQNYLSPQVASLVLQDIRKVAASGRTVNFSMPVVDSQGNSLHFDVQHWLYSDDEGKPVGVVSIARKLSTDDDDSVSEKLCCPPEFLDSLSHELRTPLAGMIGSLRVLENTQLTLEAKDYVSKCLTSSLRFKDVVNRFLGELSGNSTMEMLKNESASAEICCSGVERRCGQSLSVLLAEDDISSQVLMRKKLEAWGHSVRTACTGIEVLDCIKEQTYDLVLMDIQMPEMNGYEAISMIRGNESDSSRVPIVVMSAYGDDSNFQKMKELGITDFVSKPIRTEVLKSTLSRIFIDEDRE